DRVVVDEVAVGQRLVAGQHVDELGDGGPGRVALGRLVVEVQPGDGAGRVADGEEPDVVTGGLVPHRQGVDDRLDPAVAGRGYGNPGWRQHADPHRSTVPWRNVRLIR